MPPLLLLRPPTHSASPLPPCPPPSSSPRHRLLSFLHSVQPRHHHRRHLRPKTATFCSPDGAAAAAAATIPQLSWDEEQFDDEKWDASKYEALLAGGEQVTSVLQEMINLLEDMNMDEASETAAVELVAQGVIGKRVDEMESGFMMALDYMIRLADKDNDEQVSG